MARVDASTFTVTPPTLKPSSGRNMLGPRGKGDITLLRPTSCRCSLANKTAALSSPRLRLADSVTSSKVVWPSKLGLRRPTAVPSFALHLRRIDAWRQPTAFLSGKGERSASALVFHQHKAPIVWFCGPVRACNGQTACGLCHINNAAQRVGCSLSQSHAGDGRPYISQGFQRGYGGRGGSDVPPLFSREHACSSRHSRYEQSCIRGVRMHQRCNLPLWSLRLQCRALVVTVDI